MANIAIPLTAPNEELKARLAEAETRVAAYVSKVAGEMKTANAAFSGQGAGLVESMQGLRSVGDSAKVGSAGVVELIGQGKELVDTFKTIKDIKDIGGAASSIGKIGSIAVESTDKVKSLWSTLTNLGSKGSGLLGRFAGPATAVTAVAALPMQSFARHNEQLAQWAKEKVILADINKLHRERAAAIEAVAQASKRAAFVDKTNSAVHEAALRLRLWGQSDGAEDARLQRKKTFGDLRSAGARFSDNVDEIHRTFGFATPTIRTRGAETPEGVELIKRAAEEEFGPDVVSDAEAYRKAMENIQDGFRRNAYGADQLAARMERLAESLPGAEKLSAFDLFAKGMKTFLDSSDELLPKGELEERRKRLKEGLGLSEVSPEEQYQRRVKKADEAFDSGNIGVTIEDVIAEKEAAAKEYQRNSGADALRERLATPVEKMDKELEAVRKLRFEGPVGERIDDELMQRANEEIRQRFMPDQGGKKQDQGFQASFVDLGSMHKQIQAGAASRDPMADKMVEKADKQIDLQVAMAEHLKTIAEEAKKEKVAVVGRN